MPRITGGRVLIGDEVIDTAITLHDGYFIEDDPREAELDVANLLVLPGIVDIHGDAFERQIQPRPKVTFPHAMALIETDNQMIANGITTAYHGLTVSWEPGLRSLDAARGFIHALRTVPSTVDLRYKTSRPLGNLCD
jgi:alpha-D-ribose 1-methylphosphonate 5-triphosphate diphosphatase